MSTHNDLEATVLKALTSVAPEADPEELERDVNFRDQLDFDSMDFVAFVLALDKELGTKTPESDYPKLSSLGGCVAYFRAAAPASS